MSESISYIYGLVDPRDDVIRYVGKARNVKKRVSHHLWSSNPRSYKRNWIVSLQNKGLVPRVVILEEVLESCWEDAERKWIKWARSKYGDKVTNLCDGGIGRSAPFPVAAKRKVSRAMVGRSLSLETRLKISMAQKGRVVPPERRAKISKTLTGRQGRRPSEKSTALLIERNRQPVSEETRRKRSQAKQGWHPSIELRNAVSEKCSGEGNGGAKLSADNVADIRRRYMFRKVTMKQLAQEYCVNRCTIFRIIHNQAW